MQPEVGKIYEGKVTGITNFGAFVEIEQGVSGMVHISEVANTFVNEIKDYLTIGQEVKVKVLSVSEEGKVSLSIKKAVDNPPPQRRDNRADNKRFSRDGKDGGRPAGRGGTQGKPPAEKVPQTKEAAFEDMMNKWKQRSDEKIGDIKKNMDSKRRNTSRRRGV